MPEGIEDDVLRGKAKACADSASGLAGEAAPSTAVAAPAEAEGSAADRAQNRAKSRRIEIFPYGFSMANGPARPVLIFKDKTGQHVLPVWVHPLDATMALHEQAQTPIEPHGVAQALLKRLGIKAERCEFTELSGHRQYATLRFSGQRLASGRLLGGSLAEAQPVPGAAEPSAKGVAATGSARLGATDRLGAAGRHVVRVRADHAMSFCLAAHTRFYSTPGFMARCRELDGKLDRLAEQLQGEMALAGHMLNGREKGIKNPSYMM